MKYLQNVSKQEEGCLMLPEIVTKDVVLREKLLVPSSLETIDTAMYNYINEKFNLSTDTNEGSKKVPVIWSGAERAFQVKSNIVNKDDLGSIIFPLITVERTAVSKDPGFKGAFQAHFPDGPGPKRYGAVLARRIVADKTAAVSATEFDRYVNGILDKDPRYLREIEAAGIVSPNGTVKTVGRDRNKVIYQTVYGPIPVYIKVMYSIKIRTEYQQQMNELVMPFISKTGQINATAIVAEGHRYEAFIEGDYNIQNNINNFETEERIFQTNIDFRVLGYLMGEGPNDEKPKFSLVESIVQVKLPRERVILNDVNPNGNKTFYRS